MNNKDPSVLQGSPKDAAIDDMYQMVFSDLTEKGFLVTRGLKYGADFLAYEGDPATCHARYMVHVVDAKASENSDAAESATISM